LNEELGRHLDWSDSNFGSGLKPAVLRPAGNSQRPTHFLNGSLIRFRGEHEADDGIREAQGNTRDDDGNSSTYN
jgi:hypothetical protein